MNRTLEMLNNSKDNNFKHKMIELIPEVIPVRTKMSCPVDRAVSQAKAMTGLLATPVHRKKVKTIQERRSRTKMTMIVIFDPMPIETSTLR